MERKPNLTVIPVKEDLTAEMQRDDEEVQTPDPVLLKYQRQKTCPKISLTDVSAFADKVILEINDISELENQDQIIYGMLPAGSEETIVEQLKKQGSLKLEEPIDVEMD